MPSSRIARPTCVIRCRSTISPSFGVSQKWLPRSVYKAQKIPRCSTHFAQRGQRRGRGFLLHQLRVVDLAGGVIENDEQVVPLLAAEPAMLASVDVQQHPGQ